MMNFFIVKDPVQFLNVVEDLLMRNEVANSLSIGILKSLINKDESLRIEGEPFMAYVGEKNHPYLVLLQTPPLNLVISGTHEFFEQTAPIAVNHLETMNIPGFIGVKELVEPIVTLFNETYHTYATLEMDQRIYQLEQVTAPQNVTGHLRKATNADLTLIKDWIKAFDLEAIGEPTSEEKAQKRAEIGVASEAYYLWEDHGIPVSMAKSSRPTDRGITVTMVYTPKEQRGGGYASACVAALSQKLLDLGYDYCTLYTDLSNPISNSIYQKIGYQAIADSVAYKLVKQ